MTARPSKSKKQTKPDQTMRSTELGLISMGRNPRLAVCVLKGTGHSRKVPGNDPINIMAVLYEGGGGGGG